MHPDLEALLALQEKDQSVTQAERALAALEPEINRLDEQLAAADRSRFRAGDAGASGERRAGPAPDHAPE